MVFAVVLAVHLLAICRVGSFWGLASVSGDNFDFLNIATTIRQWHFSGGERPWHFWGFPFAIAGVSKLFSIPELTALVMISMLSSLAICILLYRLYGGWVAAFFIFIDYRWIVCFMEGGSEPLFICLLYAAFLAVRSERWKLGSLLAAFSTTVRPVGLFALLVFAVVLARRRSYRQLAAITLIGLAIGVLYIVPVWIILGSPFANYTEYRGDWGPTGRMLTYPFGAFIPSYLEALHGRWRWPVLVLCTTWLLLGLAGNVVAWLPRNRQRFSPYRPEMLFLTLYTLFFISYNFSDIAGDLARFLIPVVPLLLFSLHDWIPRDRRVLWGGAVLSALVASASLVGFRNVFGFRLP